jgi:outer membrane protein
MRHLVSALLFAAFTTTAAAQPQATGPVLSLEESIQLALRNNPTHLQARSARARAGTALRSAYGALLPSVSSSFQGSFRKGGTSVFEGQQIGAAADLLGTQYNIGVSAFLNYARFMGPRQQRANLDAAEADIGRSEAATRAQVITQYLNVLQAQARSALQDTLLINAQAQLELNRARQQVGAATQLEVVNAEVQVGRVRVSQLREQNTVEIAMLTLFQQIGIDPQPGARLVTQFPVSEPTLQLPELLEMARRANPSLTAARARESAANTGVASARSQWLPSLSFSTGWSGFTQKLTSLESQLAQGQAQGLGARRSCLTTDSIRTGAGLSALGNCDRFLFTDAQADAMRAENSLYPFDFTKQPFGYSLTLSLPIFNGFQREGQIQDAQSFRNDARYTRRAQELQLNTDVTSAYRNLTTQYQTVRLNEQNQQAARQALELAQERYRVGANTFLDVTTARSTFEQAATDLINSIYEFHKAYAALESAVGRPLR